VLHNDEIHGSGMEVTLFVNNACNAAVYLVVTRMKQTASSSADTEDVVEKDSNAREK
jgi:hypothetical protein